MWGKITIPMYRLWLHDLYGLYGPRPRCPLSSKRPINLISLSLSLNDGTVYWRIYCEIRPRWVKGRWPRRSSWRHIRFNDCIAIVFVFTVYCVLGTSLLLWIYAPIYSYICPYKHFLLPMCFKCLYILPLYILCIYSFMYWKTGTIDLLVLMLFVLQCTDYK